MDATGTDGATPDLPTPTPEHPERWQAQRHAVAAAGAQLASGFVLCALALGGLVWELGSPDSDPHGYAQIFGVILTFILLLPALGLATTALALLRNGRRSGVVWLVIAAVLSILEMVVTVASFAGGPLDPGRVVVVGGAVIWLAVSVLCVLAGARAWSRLPRTR